MKKRFARGAAVVGATVVLVAVFGTGVATADVLAGQTYADASKAISGFKGKAIIATVVGDKLPTDDCIVTRSQNARGSDKFLLYLDCNAAVASATTPGRSAATPEGRAAKKAKIDEAWRGTPDGQEWCKAAEKEHPEWFPLAGC